MSDWLPPTNEQIQQEAYYLWEDAGRPFGRESEFWMRASGMLSERAQRAAEEARWAADDAAKQAEHERRTQMLAELQLLPWPRGMGEKPMKLVKLRGPKRLPRLRGPATRPLRIDPGKTA